MQPTRITFLASLFTVGTGTLWGFYWLPVRRVSALGLPGPWGTLLIVALAVCVLLPWGIAARRQLIAADRLGLAALALGGFAFALYSTGLNYGRVAVVILLFFLTPVWSTLIARFILGARTPLLRLAAIAAGVAGLALVLGADGGLPVPRNTGDWLGLASGVLWAVATEGIRSRVRLGGAPSAFVFALGACLGTAAVAPLLEPIPGTPLAAATLPLLIWALAAGALWWGLSMAALTWAAARLDPARVGILLMAEVLVGTASAAAIAREHLAPLELLGGALVVCAGVLEVWPVRRRADSTPGPEGG